METPSAPHAPGPNSFPILLLLSLSGSWGRPQRSSSEEYHPPYYLTEAVEGGQANASHPEYPHHP